MRKKILETRLVEMENRLAFQENTIEELNQAVISHELEIARLRAHICLLIDQFKTAQLSHASYRLEDIFPNH